MATLYPTPHNLGRHRITAANPTTVTHEAQGYVQTSSRMKQIEVSTLEAVKETLKVATTKTANPISRFRFEARGSSACHPNKAGQGEDAYYISNCGTSMGVADGVGAWIEKGVDSGIYARQLMEGAKTYVEDTACTDPSIIMQATYDQARANGTSTCCVVTMDERRLRCANLGDSGFMLLRYQAPDHLQQTDSTEDLRQWICLGKAGNQQHWFNCPKQLGTDSNDLPSHADIYDIECQEGDIVISATDGFLDNVSEDDLCSLVNHYSLYEFIEAAKQEGRLSEALAEVALKLVMSASKVAQSDTRETPFAISARNEGYNYSGGKMDDTTVVVGVVVPQSVTSPIQCYGQVVDGVPGTTVTSVTEVDDIIMVTEKECHQTPRRNTLKSTVALDEYPASPVSTSSTCSHSISLSPQDFDEFDEDEDTAQH